MHVRLVRAGPEAVWLPATGSCNPSFLPLQRVANAGVGHALNATYDVVHPSEAGFDVPWLPLNAYEGRSCKLQVGGWRPGCACLVALVAAQCMSHLMLCTAHAWCRHAAAPPATVQINEFRPGSRFGLIGIQRDLEANTQGGIVVLSGPVRLAPIASWTKPGAS